MIDARTLFIRPMEDADLSMVLPIWNEVVEEGGSIPFIDSFTGKTLKNFLSPLTCFVCTDGDRLVGMYTLGPNFPGRCAGIANCTYLVDRRYRGQHIGERLVLDSLRQAKRRGYRGMQFNGVVSSNVHAMHLYERCGFKRLAVIPEGFQMKDGHLEDMNIFYKAL